jgi:DNA-binding NtrC family response regulator
MAYHLLVVDDETDVLFVLEDLFTSRGYEVTKAANGQEALRALENTVPDLVIADYQMPEMNGVDLLKRVQEKFPETVRILLTAHGDLKVAMAAINEADVYKFITKPWNNNDLLMTIRRALEHYDLMRQNRAFADTLELMVDENTQEIERLRAAMREMAAKIRSLMD